MAFSSTVLILPGLNNSGDGHWQTLWEKGFNFTRVIQQDWDTPHRTDWVDTLDKAVVHHGISNVILVGHSLACTTVAYWAAKYKRTIKGALLVAPSDTEADTYPAGTTGFVPIPIQRLPFPSIVAASSNDYYVTLDRAKQIAQAWGSELVAIADAGHINTASGFGQWPQGLDLLKKLDTNGVHTQG